jgi:hypothetical protein
MADDSSSTSLAPSQDVLASSHHDDHVGTALDESPPQHQPGRRRRRRRNKNPGLAKKLEFFRDLHNSMEFLIFAELSALYYMECNLVLLLARFAFHFSTLSLKERAGLSYDPQNRVSYWLIMAANAFCFTWHWLQSLPQGPDFHRGYQHGGILIDFIGQKPPTSRVYYLLADLVIFVLQMLMVTISSEYFILRSRLKPPHQQPIVISNARQPEVAAAIANHMGRDLDAEERGLPPGRVMFVDEGDSIEMGPLSRRSRNHEEGGGQEDQGGPSRRSGNSHSADVMNSGNGILGEFNVFQSIRSAPSDFKSVAAHSLQSIGYEATLAALTAQRQAS